jgi:ribosomal protein L24
MKEKQTAPDETEITVEGVEREKRKVKRMSGSGREQR